MQENFRKGIEMDVTRMLLFNSGYLLGEAVQGIDPATYKKIAQGLANYAYNVGLAIDPYFFRNQMSGFFGAAFYSSIASAIIHHSCQTKNDNNWLQKRPEEITAAVVGTILICYEALQAIVDKRPIDIHDLVAYTAGLGVFLSSNKIWDWYCNFKNRLGGANLG